MCLWPESWVYKTSPVAPSTTLFAEAHFTRNLTGWVGTRKLDEIELSLIPERCLHLSEKQGGNCLSLDDDRNAALKQTNGND